MASSSVKSSDNNECAYGADFLELAHELEIDEGLLESVLDDAVRLMRQTSPSTRPANKKALRGVPNLLVRTLERLSKTGVRERLVGAVIEEPEEPDESRLARYLAWGDAEQRVGRAIEGARDLLAIVERGKAINFPSGRPEYEHCVVAIRSLLGFWSEDLQREVTISGHPEDGRKVKPSATLRFIHESMRLIGRKMPEQACRRILQNIRHEFGNCGTKPWTEPDR